MLKKCCNSPFLIIPMRTNHHCKICFKNKIYDYFQNYFRVLQQMLIFHTKKKNLTEQIRMFKNYLFIYLQFYYLRFWLSNLLACEFSSCQIFLSYSMLPLLSFFWHSRVRPLYKCIRCNHSCGISPTSSWKVVMGPSNCISPSL